MPALQFGHELFGEQFFVTTLRVPRLSGAEDFLPVTLSERLLIDEPIAAGSVLCLDGQLRSYNKVVEGSGRLLITAFAQRLLPEEDDENPNRVQLTGALCKAPSYRTTPFGREIADLMLAVNRSYGKERLHSLHHLGPHGPICRKPENRRPRFSWWAAFRAAIIRSSFRMAPSSTKWRMRSASAD